MKIPAIIGVIFTSIFGIALIIGIILGTWYLKRKINYAVAYQSLVEQTVRDMVKPECLKNPKE